MPSIPLTHANIIELLGIASLPLGERKEIVMKAIELVETRTFNQVMDQLEEGEQERLSEALDAEDHDTITELLETAGVDLLALTEEEVERVKHELLELKNI